MRVHLWSVMPAALVAATALAIAGCGGGSASHPVTVPTPASTAVSGRPAGIATFTLTIPNRTATMARTSPKYISSSVVSGSISVSPGGTSQYYNLATNSPLCTTVANGRSCTLSAAAPIGSDTFTVVLYDSNSSAVSAGTTIPTTIQEGAANNVLPLVLGGVLDHATVAIVQPTAYHTSGASGQVVITGYDHGNNIIIAPGGYVDALGNAVTIEIDASSSPGYALERNSGTAATDVYVTSPSDVVSIAQFSVRSGVRLAYTASNGATITGDTHIAPAYASSETTVTAATMLVTPGPMQGVNGVLAGVDHTGADVFLYDGVSTKTTCQTGPTGLDGAPTSTSNTVFYATSGGVASTATSISSPSPCSPVVVASLAQTLFTPNGADIYAINPGTLSSACSGVMNASTWTLNGTSCTSPRNLTQDGLGIGGFAFTFTSSSGQEVAYFNGVNDPGTHVVVASSGNAVGLGAEGGFIYVVQTQSNAVNVYSVPNLTLVSSFPLPAYYTSGCLLNNARQFVIGDNGAGFLTLGGIGCNHDGVLEFALPSGTLLNFFSSLAGVYSVASDHRGHIYWSNANGQLIEFPSATP